MVQFYGPVGLSCIISLVPPDKAILEINISDPDTPISKEYLLPEDFPQGQLKHV